MKQSNNYTSIKDALAQKNVRLVAVSKTKANEAILEKYEQGQRIFGENRVQELTTKYDALPKDIEWHLIGHLQTNKVKYIAPFVAMIHSIDSPRLLKEVNKQALKSDRIIDCLLQMHIAEEETKYGMELAEVETFLSSAVFANFQNVRICGVMGMATFTDDSQQVRSEFKQLKNIFDTLKGKYFSSADYFKEISMGMSGDYSIAVEEGSTMVRIGSLIFGER